VQAKAAAPVAAPGGDAAPEAAAEDDIEDRTKRLEFTALLQALAAMQEGQGAEFMNRARERLTQLSTDLDVDLPAEAFGAVQ
jgi:hypothetical protein